MNDFEKGDKEFIPTDLIRDIYEKRNRVFAKVHIVKAKLKGRGGYINLSKSAYIPSKYVGRRVRLMIEVLEEESK